MSIRRLSLVRGSSVAFLIAAMVATTGGLDVAPQAQAAVPAAAAKAAAVAHVASTGSITLAVESARTVGVGLVQKGDSVDHYKWLINVDDTGNPGTAATPGYEQCLPSRAKDDLGNPIIHPATTPPATSVDSNYADFCPWPSTRTTSGWANIVAQGDETTLNKITALPTLPNGKYLISVTAPDYKIDGQHFTVAGTSTLVTVGMQPYPLPLQTIRIQVFNDNAPVDATWEMDAEPGLAGFTGYLSDVFGLVSTDYYGNALCTKYMRVGASGPVPEFNNTVTGANNLSAPVAFADGKPVIDPASIRKCVSGADGVIVIPNLGPNRYGATVTAPRGAGWVQTTTLEGGHDFDIWQQENESGYDTEQTKGAEQVPYVHFGFVRTMPIAAETTPPTGEIKGVAVVALTYIGGQNGQIVPQTGLAGAKYGGRINRPWVALSDLGAGDQQVYVGRGAKDGTFDIKNVPDGTYQLSLWDDAQDYILWSFNVTVENGELVDVGNKALMGWFTRIHGTVFVDTNGNGKRDKGELPVPAFTLTLRERDNSAMDQMTNTISTNESGVYDIKEAYPLGKWLILEAFNTRYQTTGVTYKADNEPKATTLTGAAVDINVLNIIGLGGTVDWGVQPYVKAENGGIVGTISYDTTRNELDPRYAVSESYQPGIPGVPVSLHLPVKCGTDQGVACTNGYEVDGSGAYLKGLDVSDTITSESWAAPRGCTARDWQGKPLVDQQALPPFGKAADNLCVEAPMMGFTVGASDPTPGNFGQTVNGNYGFGTSSINQYPLGSPKSPVPSL
ncbi:MAG: hypothetical protein QOG52_1671, partial [Frankiaceae bacterium]|nr:hypothetical protein [Frankiaceae bacterium]